MSLIRYLELVASGKLRYWNRHMDPVTTKFDDRLERGEGPIKAFFTLALGASTAMLQEILISTDHSPVSLRVDVRSLKEKQLQNLLGEILSAFAFKLIMANPRLPSPVINALGLLLEDAQKMSFNEELSSWLKVEKMLPGSYIRECWKRIEALAGVDQGTDEAAVLAFGTRMTGLYIILDEGARRLYLEG